MSGLLKDVIKMFFEKKNEMKTYSCYVSADFLHITKLYMKEGKVYRAEVKKESQDHVAIEEPYVILGSKCEGYFPQVAIPYTIGKIQLKVEMGCTGLVVRLELMPTLKKHQEIMLNVNYMYKVICSASFSLTSSWERYDSGLEKDSCDEWGRNPKRIAERVVHKLWYEEEVLPFLENLVSHMRKEIIKNREMCLWFRDGGDF